MLDIREIKNQLDVFCKAIRSDIRRGIQSKEYYPEKKIRKIFGPGTEFQIKDGFINVPQAISYEVIEENWSSAAKQVANKFNPYSKKLNLHWQFVYYIISSLFPNKNIATNKILREYLKICRTQRASIYCRAAIFGIAPKDESVSFSFMRLRCRLFRFTKEEYAELYWADHLHHISPNLPSSWLEIHYPNVKVVPLRMVPEEGYFKRADRDLDILISLLKLYRTSSISIAWSSVDIGDHASYFLHGAGAMPGIEIYRASLSQEDFRYANRIFIRDFASLSDYSIYCGDKGEAHIKVALEMYNDALKEPQPHKRVAYIIMGLEALFTTNEAQLKRSLSMRVGWLVYGLTGKDYTKLINKAYDIRSAYAHGDPGVKKQLAKFNFHGNTDKTIHKLADILRISLLVAIKNSKKPPSFLREDIDDIMIFSRRRPKEYNIPKSFIA